MKDSDSPVLAGAMAGFTFTLPMTLAMEAMHCRLPRHERYPSEIQVEGEAGSVLVMDSRLWHASGPNGTPEPRVAFGVRYAPWWLNLEAHPEAQIQVKDVRRQVRVIRATLEEKQRLWPLLTAMYSGYKQYQEITDRDIPVAICR